MPARFSRKARFRPVPRLAKAFFLPQSWPKRPVSRPAEDVWRWWIGGMPPPPSGPACFSSSWPFSAGDAPRHVLDNIGGKQSAGCRAGALQSPSQRPTHPPQGPGGVEAASLFVDGGGGSLRPLPVSTQPHRGACWHSSLCAAVRPPRGTGGLAEDAFLAAQQLVGLQEWPGRHCLEGAHPALFRAPTGPSAIGGINRSDRRWQWCRAGSTVWPAPAGGLRPLDWKPIIRGRRRQWRRRLILPENPSNRR